MTEKFSVKQKVFSQRDVIAMAGKAPDRNRDAYDVFHRLNLTASRETDVFTALGIMALHVCARGGLSMHQSAPLIGEVTREAFVILAMDIDRWAVRGTPEQTTDFRQWLMHEAAQGSTNRVRAMLAINERASKLYLVLEGCEKPFTASDISEAIALATEPVISVLHAGKLANIVRDYYPSVLFTADFTS